MNRQKLSAVFGLMLAAACGGSETNSGKDIGSSAQGLPCEVEAIVEKHCGLCHGENLTAGAPVKLVSYTDFHEKDGRDEPRYARVKDRLHDEASPMPPIDHARLSEKELEVLDAWLDKKAPKGKEACEEPDPVDGDETPDEEDLSECDELIELRANDGDDAEGKSRAFSVPMEDDYYECFVFEVPWTDQMHALRVDPLIDDERVLHHWLLYQDPIASAGKPGSHSACGGVHADGTLVAGWAPGGSPYAMPKDVGLHVDSAKTHVFVLEIHYNNVARYDDANDKSGARLCVTRKLRKNVAGTHWLGTDLIVLPPGKGTAEGDCKPKEEAHILSVSPHMHQLGRHMSTLITRADGSEEMLHDAAFDFNDQRVYGVKGGPVVVGAGDTLKTTCTFDNDSGRYVTFGSGTSDEMCYNFVVAYPIGSLGTGGSFLGGENKCMQ